MRLLGCIPAKKFINDITLIKDMRYTLQKLHASVLMYPEASYSFDGTETPLPDSLGKCIKLLKVPVIMLRTYGAFLRDPLYIGDMISIGDAQVQYYCFPKHGENVVAKTRLATEELYRMKHHGIG